MGITGARLVDGDLLADPAGATSHQDDPISQQIGLFGAVGDKNDGFPFFSFFSRITIILAEWCYGSCPALYTIKFL